MRNPLSAVIQCADSSIDAINQISRLAAQMTSDNLENSRREIQEHIRASLDAQQTIVSCSLHQKRVIDDILTLSKLDSNLILITPIRVQPVAVVAEAVKMFEVESSKDGIELSFVEDPSLLITGATWVMMDPSRLLQVSNHYSSADRTRDELFRSSLTF
jgi:signal transduction histidine kinase